MVVNDYAGCLIPRGALGFIASRLAPTRDLWHDTHTNPTTAAAKPSGHGIILHLLFPAPAKGAIP
ncbi:hypothetical protein CD175_23375 [Pseudomonas laurylsulfatiphila]|uniref:Uncharacterized protein n=1 Tax=Pseudomonas laurylsulfatiphila TaxID=2011015 RepID=A0A2S6FGM8_9PSED|nr:hypothetical protein CD175_23375 [Pseudomonas laurylsulfatiphila]